MQRTREPRRAMWLSVALPGAGQVWTGRYGAASMIWLTIVLLLLPAPLILAFASIVHERARDVVVVGVYVLLLGAVWLEGARDARRGAEAARTRR